MGEIREKVIDLLIENQDDTAERPFEIAGCERRKRINMVSTYTVDRLKPGLLQWIEGLNRHAEVRLADFNQVFQELGRKDSPFRTTRSGLNVIALRYEERKPNGLP